MILSGDPKHRHGFRASLLEATGEFHGRECFVDRVKWAGEQTCLLARNNCNTILMSQELDVLQRLLPRSPALIHGRERITDPSAIGSIRAQDFGHAFL